MLMSGITVENPDPNSLAPPVITVRRKPSIAAKVSKRLSEVKRSLKTKQAQIGLPVLLPTEPESVLLGAAMLAVYDSVHSAVVAMGGEAFIISPKIQDIPYHDKKYRVFLKMVTDQKSYEKKKP